MKNSIYCIILSIILFVTSALSAQSLPELNDSAAQALNTEQEEMLGQQIMLKVRQQTPFSDDPLLLSYIAQLSARLAEHSPRPLGSIKTYLAIDSAINAFAVPGGYVTLNTGLIENTHSEDELAAVIAHEIGHHSQRHISRSIERSKQLSLPATAAIIGGILIGGQVGTAAVVSTQAMLGADRLAYSKVFEAEADATGMKILAAAGYSTLAMPTFFGQLEKKNRLLGGQLPDFLRTHPVSRDRIADSLSRADRLNSAPRQNPISPLDYAHAKTRIQALYAEAVDSIIAKFTAQAAKHPNDVDIQNTANYGLFLAYVRKGNYANAQQNLDNMITLQANDRLVKLSRAELALAMGNIEQALEIYAGLYELEPGSSVNTKGYAQTLFQIKDYKGALRVLRKTLRRAPEQIWAYTLLAQTYGAQGKTFNALFNQAQKLKHTGQYSKALSLLKQQSANSHPDKSSYLIASIEDLSRQIEQAKQRLESFKL